MPAVPLRDLRVPVLCRRHNGLLSGDDAAIGTFAQAARGANRPDEVSTLEVDGWALERWCLKALIGLTAGGWVPMPDNVEPLAHAPLDLAEAAFGRRVLSPERGLHCVVARTQFLTGDIEERVSWAVMQHHARPWEIVGGVLVLPPFTFAIPFHAGDMSAAVASLTVGGQAPWSDVRVVARPPGIDAKTDQGCRVNLRLHW